MSTPSIDLPDDADALQELVRRQEAQLRQQQSQLRQQESQLEEQSDRIALLEEFVRLLKHKPGRFGLPAWQLHLWYSRLLLGLLVLFLR